MVSSTYICGAFRSNEEGPSCSLLGISHTTPPILGKLNTKYYVDSSGQYLLIALIQVCIYVVRSGATEKAPRVLCLIFRILPRRFWQAEYCMDSSGQYLLIALIHTAEIQL